MKKTLVCLGMMFASFTNAALAASDSLITDQITIATSGVTPLCTAISKGEIEIVKKFVEYGADVNERSNGMTPLMVAARYNQVEIMEYLISKGADMSAKSENGFTALKYAELSNAQDAVSYLKNNKNQGRRS